MLIEISNRLTRKKSFKIMISYIQNKLINDDKNFDEFFDYISK